MLCDIEVQDTPTIVTDDEKAIERAEGSRRNREEVHRGSRFNSRSGAIDGRPTSEYNLANFGNISFRISSTILRIGRSG
jgi:hypothetical protein